jgi:adenylate cyclase
LKRARSRKLLATLLVAGGLAVVLVALRNTYLFDAVELKSLDARHRVLADRSEADSSIVIVDVDNLSLDLARETLGRFPWPREAWAVVTDYLTAAGAKVIAFDFVFSEPDLVNPAGDVSFAEATQRAGNVVQSVVFQKVGDTAQVHSAYREDSATVRALLSRFGRPASAQTNEYQVVQAPFAGLLAAARHVGSINFEPDGIDGVARRSPLVFGYRGHTFPSFALAAAATADSTVLNDLSDAQPRLIKWHGPYRSTATGEETYRVIPAAQIFKSYDQLRVGETPEVPLEVFKDRIVLIGASGSGLFETRATPFSGAEPGILIQATLTDNILHRSFVTKAATISDVLAVVLLALVTAVIVATTPATVGAVSTLALMAVYTGFALWLFAARSVWVGIVAPLSAALLTFTAGMVINYLMEGRQKKQIRDMFSKYVSPEYVAVLAEDPSKLHLEGRRAEISLLFSDIRGFTSISEKLEPPEVIAFLNDYLDDMAEIVKSSGGTLDKFIGDAVMAFWNDPIEVADHADRACDCALAMRDATLRISERFEREGKPRIRIGVGVNTGDVVVGNIGSLKHKLDYTAIGDAVNLASRLEGLNKDFSTTIIISEFTRAKVAARFETRPLGQIQVKGKLEPVQVYELLGRTPAVGERGG